MKNLHIEATKQTPQVDFNAQEGIFKISGKSYPENVNSCYEPLFQYIEEYITNPQANTKLEFTWLYYSTSTNKMIIRLIMLLKSANTKLEIGWYYNEGFDMIMEKGKEIGEILELPLTLKQL